LDFNSHANQTYSSTAYLKIKNINFKYILEIRRQLILVKPVFACFAFKYKKYINLNFVIYLPKNDHLYFLIDIKLQISDSCSVFQRSFGFSAMYVTDNILD